MTAARRNQVTRLFEAALKKEPSERLAYLDGVSEFDPDLRKEVESLLAAEGESFLDKTPPSLREDIVPPAGSRRIQGPNYNGRLAAFVREKRDPHLAVR